MQTNTLTYRQLETKVKELSLLAEEKEKERALWYESYRNEKKKAEALKNAIRSMAEFSKLLN